MDFYDAQALARVAAPEGEAARLTAERGAARRHIERAHSPNGSKAESQTSRAALPRASLIVPRRNYGQQWRHGAVQTFTIHVDGLAYGGENPDAEDEPLTGALGQTHQLGPRDALCWGGTPKRIHGRRGLRSEIARIMDRGLPTRELVIKVEP